MKIDLSALIALLAVSATGIANAGFFSSGWEEDQARYQACFRGLDGDADVHFVDSRLAVSRDPTSAQLSDTSTPTAEEVEIMRRALPKRQPCRDMQVDVNKKHHPLLVPALQLRNFQDDIVFIQLLQRRITYGNGAQLLQQNWLEFKAREAQYNQARSEEERRAQSAAVEALSRQAHAAPPPPPGASRLNCRWIGPTLYCNTY